MSGWKDKNCDEGMQYHYNNPSLMYYTTKHQSFVTQFILTDVNECDNSPCQNGGTCINSNGSYYCDCTDGWTSNITDCETGIFSVMRYRDIYYKVFKSIMKLVLTCSFGNCRYTRYWMHVC